MQSGKRTCSQASSYRPLIPLLIQRLNSTYMVISIAEKVLFDNDTKQTTTRKLPGLFCDCVDFLSIENPLAKVLARDVRRQSELHSRSLLALKKSLPLAILEE